MPGLDPRWSRRVEADDADGVRRSWHVLDNGAEPVHGTMLCVHGNPTWSYLWRRFLAEAPAGWRVVAVDQLGMGWSERTAARTLAQRVDDLGSLTDALGITGPVVTVAHDWGGPVSLGWALAHRAQLRAVVLTNTAVHQPAGAAAPSLIRLARTPGLRQAICVASPAFVRTTSALSWPPLPAPVRDALAAPYATPSRRQAVGDFVADIPLDPAHPSAATLDRIAEGLGALADVPVLMLWGPRDPVFSDLYLRDLLGRLPHAQVHRYEGASHLVTEDAPRTAGDVWAWVADLEGSARRPRPAGGRRRRTAVGRPLRTRGRPDAGGRGAGPAPPQHLLRPAGPPGPRPGCGAGRDRRAPGRPGRPPRAARRGPDRHGLRLLACRRRDRRRRRRPGPAGDGTGAARRRPRPRHRHRQGPGRGARHAGAGAPHRRRPAGRRHPPGPRRPARPGRPGPARPGPRPAGAAPGRRRVRHRVHLRRHRPGQGRGLPAPPGAGPAGGAALDLRPHGRRPARRGLRAVRALRPRARPGLGRPRHGRHRTGHPDRRRAGRRRRGRPGDRRLRLTGGPAQRRGHRRRPDPGAPPRPGRHPAADVRRGAGPGVAAAGGPGADAAGRPAHAVRHDRGAAGGRHLALGAGGSGPRRRRLRGPARPRRHGRGQPAGRRRHQRGRPGDHRRRDRRGVRAGRARQGPLRPALGHRARERPHARLAPHRRRRPPGRPRPALGRGPARARGHRSGGSGHPGRGRAAGRGPRGGRGGRLRRRRSRRHPAGRGRRRAVRGRHRCRRSPPPTWPAPCARRPRSRSLPCS